MLKKRRYLQPLAQTALAVVSFLLAAVAVSQEQTTTQENAEPLEVSESSPSFDVNSASAWMQRLARIVSESSFEISYVVSSDGRETLPYVWRHAVLENGDKAEQLSLLNGPGFERIRFNNKLSLFEPGYTPYSVRAEHIDGPIPLAFLYYPEMLKDSYDILLMGRDRVSGRMAQQIRVVSKDKTRYGYYLWLDESTGLLLKMNMYGTDNRILKQIQVIHFALSDEINRFFANIQRSQLPPISVPNAEIETEFSWTVSYLPVGMTKVKQTLHRLSTTGQPAEYMMLSDGLVDISVYVMQDNDLVQEDLSVSSNATSVVSISNGRIQVTVVGDIPSATANQIADSIVLVDANK